MNSIAARIGRAVSRLEANDLELGLLVRIAKGDEKAVVDCIDRYGGLVWSLARKFSPTTADAEDAAQEIFIDIWKNATRFDEQVSAEPTFVAMLARRRLIDRLRKSNRKPAQRSLSVSEDDKAQRTAVPAIEVADDVAKAVSCLERLSGSQRKVLELAIYQALPQSQIAAQTGLPLGTVKTHARRGLAQLKACVESTISVLRNGGTPK